jgi:hypothetical protein
MRLLTRGLGGGQGSGLILGGMTEVVRIVRAGRTIVKEVIENFLEEFTIAVKLLEINGKEILSPIFNRRKYIIDESIEHRVSVRKVKFKSIEENKTKISAKLLRINRGYDGKN